MNSTLFLIPILLPNMTLQANMNLGERSEALIENPVSLLKNPGWKMAMTNLNIAVGTN